MSPVNARTTTSPVTTRVSCPPRPSVSPPPSFLSPLRALQTHLAIPGVGLVSLGFCKPPDVAASSSVFA